MKKYFTLFILVFIPLLGNSQQVTTLAGSSFGFADGATTAAKFNNPIGICIVRTGTLMDLYVVDSENNRIRKIDGDGNVTTIAGSTYGSEDGPGATARFIQPNGICTDGNGFLYVTDWANNRIRKIAIATGVVSTLAGNTKGYFDAAGTSAMFDHPTGICYGGNGILYVVDSGNHKIRKVIIATANVLTLAGTTQGYSDGIASTAQFNNPQGICSDGNENLYLTDYFNNCIRKINLTTSMVSTIAGSINGYVDGIGTAARFRGPGGICIDNNSNIYVADGNNNRIRKIAPSTEVTTFAGFSSGTRDGAVDYASFYGPRGIVLDNDGAFYIADSGNSRIRKITDTALASAQNIFSINNIELFPNPTAKFTTINYNLSKDGLVGLKLFSSQGQQLFESKTNKKAGENSESIDLSGQSSGVYFLKINSNGQGQTFKIVKN